MRIAVYRTSSKGAEIIRSLVQGEYIGKEDVEAGILPIYNVVIFPGGSEHIFTYLRSKPFRVAIHRYVHNGGRYIGICGGAFLGILMAEGGFSILKNLKFLNIALYYTYYMLFNKLGKFQIEWSPENIFGLSGKQNMTWGGGPYIKIPNLNVDATFSENKFLLHFKNKPAISSGFYGNGKIVLFGPHPEYPCDGVDNKNLISQAAEWLIF